jgi:pyruvate formate lyase activating enzyme
VLVNEKMHEAMLWEKERNGIRCILCARRCFISKDKRGFCQVRLNKDNVLYTLNYGKLVAVNVDPIEKKPFFHFYPGSTALSIASVGCNFRCQFCDNWELSQVLYKDPDTMPGKDYTPEQVVELAEKNNCKSIAYTYTEPTMFFEFAYKTAKLAKRNNIMNVFVTNGYITEDAIKKISKYLDAVVVDIKASLDPEFYKKFMSVKDVQPIYDALKQIKKQRILLEITNLIIPQIGDNIELCTKLAEYINTNLTSSVPFHILQFHPSYKLMELPPTPIATLERCVSEARKTGLRYVYIGNIPGHDDENTYCYNCRELLVKRFGAGVEEINMVKDRCPYCGANIDIVVED